MSQSSAAEPPSTDPIRALIVRVERRLRFREGLERAVTGSLVALMLGLVLLTLAKTGWLVESTFLVGLGGLASLPIAGFVSAWLGSRDSVRLAQRIDRSHDLHDRMSTAISLVDGDRTASPAFTRAQLEDALAHVDAVDPARAVPLRTPRDLRMAGLFLAAFGLLWAVEPPSHEHPLPDPPRIQHDPVLDSATLTMEQEEVERMKDQLEGTDDPEAKQVVEEIDKLLEDAEKRRISSREFLERVDDIKKKHFDNTKDESTPSTAEDLKQAAESLEDEMGEALNKEPEMKKAVEAMQQKDTKGASKALKKLAEKMTSGDDMSSERRKRLSKMMKKLAQNMDRKKLEEMLKKHEDLARKLAQKMKSQGELSQGEKRRLDRAKQKADELRKKLDSKKKDGSGDSEQKRQLEQLRRRTKKADDQTKKKAARQKKKDGEKQQSKSSDTEKDDEPDYRNRPSGRSKQASEKKQSQKQKRSKQVQQMARKQLEELRKSVKRSRPGGSGQKQRARSGQNGSSGKKMRDYLRRAKGESKQGSAGKRQGKKRGQRGRDSSSDSRESGRSGGKQGSKSNAEKGGRQGGEKGSKQANQSGKDTKSSERAGSGEGGEALGDKKTSMENTKRKDTHVDGRGGKGPSKAQIIRTASEKGFATREYKDVYSDYSSVAEEVMEREDVPPGYRYYVKRYFELIKPRDEQSSSK